jgi:hypothetical protein
MLSSTVKSLAIEYKKNKNNIYNNIGTVIVLTRDALDTGTVFAGYPAGRISG